jgi:hypothetical protein
MPSSHTLDCETIISLYAHKLFEPVPKLTRAAGSLNTVRVLEQAQHIKRWNLTVCICISCIAVFATCDAAGLGETIDLTAPELTLEELIQENAEPVDLAADSGSIYIGASFTIKGTARDNKALDRIVVEELLSEGSVRTDESRSALSGNNPVRGFRAANLRRGLQCGHTGRHVQR